jgi:hypothetical protein
VSSASSVVIKNCNALAHQNCHYILAVSCDTFGIDDPR